MSVPEKRDNYRITLERTRELFLKYDQADMIRRFDLRSDSEFLFLNFLSKEYRICRKTAAIERFDGVWCPADHNDGMTIYDILCDSKPNARIAGLFENVWNQRNVSSAPNGSLFQGTADFFSGKCEQLCAACARLNGIKLPVGDAGYDIPVFKDISMRLLFWDADDEFPANLNLQWDRNIFDFMRYETTFYAAGFVLNRLQAEAKNERSLEKSV